MKRLILAILVIGVLLFSGCAPARVSEPAIPAHFTTYTDEMGLFSISYPPDWEPALFLIEGLEQFTKEIIESVETGLPLERVSTIFFAGVPTEMYSPNVNIICESLPGTGWTHDKAVEAEIEGIKLVVQDYHEYSQVKTTVSGREATIVDLEVTYPVLGRFRALAMIILTDEVVWIVTCKASGGEFSKWEDDFYAIVRSLRILK